MNASAHQLRQPKQSRVSISLRRHLSSLGSPGCHRHALLLPNIFPYLGDTGSAPSLRLQKLIQGFSSRRTEPAIVGLAYLRKFKPVIISTHHLLGSPIRLQLYYFERPPLAWPQLPIQSEPDTLHIHKLGSRLKRSVRLCKSMSRRSR